MTSLTHFHARRQQIFNLIGDNSIVLIAAAPPQFRNSDTEYPFRQDSYFYYLTGFEESYAIVALLKSGGKNRFILFCQDSDPHAEQWTGPRAGLKGANEIYGADEAYSITQATTRFPEIFSGISTVYYLINNNPAFDRKLFSWLGALRNKQRTLTQTPYKFIDLRVILDELRLIKDKEELTALRKACEIAAHAHISAMKACQAGMLEYELEATLLYEFCRKGGRQCAYPSIVAGGTNACILHYTRNQSPLKDGDLLLIDAGAEYENYASDITRTFPINGKFSASQQAIYELVLASQMAAIKHVGPNISWNEIQQTILKVLVQGLVDLKILKGEVSTLIEEEAYLPFYMHNSGHWLGLDVHDVGEYKAKGASRKLMPGMVFTIEPGLYLDANNRHIPEKWRGIGVRIEDDIVITPEGVEVLTTAAPKTVADIEKLMKR